MLCTAQIKLFQSLGRVQICSMWPNKEKIKKMIYRMPSIWEHERNESNYFIKKKTENISIRSLNYTYSMLILGNWEYVNERYFSLILVLAWLNTYNYYPKVAMAAACHFLNKSNYHDPHGFLHDAKYTIHFTFPLNKNNRKQVEKERVKKAFWIFFQSREATEKLREMIREQQYLGTFCFIIV